MMKPIRPTTRAGLVSAAVVMALTFAACSSDAGGGEPIDLGSGDPVAGAALYTKDCSACHGDKGGGTDFGPPLVDEIYRPGHHADITFLLAVNSGVRPHHWGFGPMPAIPGLSDTDVADIVAYVRDLQEQAGI